MPTFFTSESVAAGHPDKICDQISDAILDAYLEGDPSSCVAVECLITTGQLVIAGEVRSSIHVDAVQVACQVLERLGYTGQEVGFDVRTTAITVLIHEQSPEIGSGVDGGGAGDQGLMFGYACQDTPEGMPLAIALVHRLIHKREVLRSDGVLSGLRHNAKVQVMISVSNGITVGVEGVVLSTQHDPVWSLERLREAVTERIILPVIREVFPDARPECLVNPAGTFIIGGPHGDTGLTGRKIIVDTYGGSCPHGGGAFSGKDPRKVDRSAAYAARWGALHLVRAGMADRCTVQLSYAIGRAEPTSLFVDTHGSGKVPEHLLGNAIRQAFDLTPAGIIRDLDLRRTIYQPTASGGHFGRSEFPWEQIDQNRIMNLLKDL
ncbi:MAG: methionine adenosyltransferase [Saprospiraceae bacterium]|nr:methionine adenosyltransferase [Saprospiraceae bacterium]